MTLSNDVERFVRVCIPCISTTGGEPIPRPFGPFVHGTKPNDLPQFDYIELRKATAGDQYILRLCDDHSRYTCLYLSSSTEAEQAAYVIIDLCAESGPPAGFMSDGPTHF